MVDNENQWDDIEYTEDNNQNYSDYTDDDNEYSEDDYNDEDYEEEQQDIGQKKKSNQLPLVILALILFGIAGFLALSKMQANKDAGNFETMNNTPSIEQTEIPNIQQNSNEEDAFFSQDTNSENMMSIDFNENGDVQVQDQDGNGDVVATIKDNNDLFGQSSNDIGFDVSNENNDIIISYDKAARTNPFKIPERDKLKDYNDNVIINNTQFEIIEPPVTLVEDNNLTMLLKTQISGILYDDESPSAIVNINGVDNFVKEGDTISGYKIQSITRDKVQISYKNNTYVASVGELFTKGVLEKKPAVANLEKKFAGRYSNN